eukprot:8530235-Pyramimonas_sp.AAC.1
MLGLAVPLLSGIPLAATGVPVPPLKGAPARPQQDSDIGKYFLETFNGSCWRTLRRRLAETDAIVLRAQE